MRIWLLDTGPLVAYVDAGDRSHAEVAAGLDGFSGELCTTDAVITEAMHMVGDDPNGPSLLVDFVEASGLRVYECARLPDLRRAVALMSKYGDTPMDFADATLIGLAERLNTLDIVTLDRRGFSTYRTSRGKALRRVLDQADRGLSP